MQESFGAALRQTFGDGYCLRTPSCVEDIARVAAFIGQIHGSGVAALTSSLFASYPGMQPADFIFVEEEATQTVVSSLCLIPWRMRYGAASLSVGEMGIVGTLEPHRRRGLVRAQVLQFWRRFAERNCAISLIQGIPFYYRQFGYTYALPLEGGWRIDAHNLPPLAETQPAKAFAFRQATEGDLPTLSRLYNEAALDLAIYAERDEATWRYSLGAMQATELACEWWLIEDAALGGEPAGYLRLPHSHFGAEMAVGEVSRLSLDAAAATLRQLLIWAEERKLPGVRLNLSASSSLVQLARGLGAQDLGRYAWQVAIPDPAAFLSAIVPELQRRLAAAPAVAGWCGELPINLFRSGALLAIDNGRIAVTPTSGSAGGPVNIPPDAFAPIVLGYRTVDETLRFFPDLHVDGHLRPLFDVLFPPVAGHLYAAV